jgi:hypothetical protein
MISQWPGLSNRQKMQPDLNTTERPKRYQIFLQGKMLRYDEMPIPRARSGITSSPRLSATLAMMARAARSASVMKARTATARWGTSLGKRLGAVQRPLCSHTRIGCIKILTEIKPLL